MKKLQITKEAFEKSRYFTSKYGKLEYVSESGKLFKTDKGRILKFSESTELMDEDTDEGTFEGNAHAVLDEAYAAACDGLERLGIDYDSSGDNTIYFNDTDAKKTYAFTFGFRECDHYDGE